MQRNLIDEAVRALNIQAVLLRSSATQANEALLPPADLDLAVVARYRSGPTDEFEVSEMTDEGDNAVTMVIFRFKAAVRLVDHVDKVPVVSKKKAKTREPVSELIVRLEISAEFGAHYRLRPGSDVEALKPALEEFGACNVGFHVWPYWREYVQSTCARMGIPTIPVGVYRLPKPAEAKS